MNDPWLKNESIEEAGEKYRSGKLSEGNLEVDSSTMAGDRLVFHEINDEKKAGSFKMMKRDVDNQDALS